jgi:outer membrane protein OmpA-like peptidoglycan-associated protein
MPGHKSGWLGAVCALAVLSAGPVVLGQAAPPAVPLVPGLTIVLAAHNPAIPGAINTVRNVAQGDYELVVAVTGVSAAGIDETTRIDGVDENKKPLQLAIRRRVLTADLASSRTQILGFHTDDAQELPGTTSLGPSLAVVRDLRTTGHAAYSVINFRGQAVSTGTLTRVGTTSVPFPVLLNGRRTTLPAMRVTGMLKYGDKVRPWEQLIFDDPKHPLTLRFTYGAVGEGTAFTPEFTREVVRIDFPAADDRAMEETLSKTCRVEVPGIYFDFDRATLNPQSSRAMTTIAELLRRQPQWRLSIEGHTDNSGRDAYNQDLSVRRAAAVRAALVGDFAIAPARLTSAGFGATRPVETNDTIAGRAHNRRVELVRDCAGKP